MTIVSIILLSLVGVAGDYFLKLSGSGPKYVEIKWFIIGALIYASTAVGWFLVMKHIKLASLGIIYAITIVIALAGIGVIFFKETLNMYEIIGLIIGFISILLLARFA